MQNNALLQNNTTHYQYTNLKQNFAMQYITIHYNLIIPMGKFDLTRCLRAERRYRLYPIIPMGITNLSSVSFSPPPLPYSHNLSLSTAISKSTVFAVDIKHSKQLDFIGNSQDYGVSKGKKQKKIKKIIVCFERQQLSDLKPVRVAVQLSHDIKRT